MAAMVRPSKSDFFARSEFILIKICADLCSEIAIKHIKFEEKTLSIGAKNIKKVSVLLAPRSKVKKLRRFKKILPGHASACPCVLEALAMVPAKSSNSNFKG